MSDILSVVLPCSGVRIPEEESQKVRLEQSDTGCVGNKGDSTDEYPLRRVSSTLVEKAGQSLKPDDCCLSDVDFEPISEHNCGCRLRKDLGFGLRIFFTRNSG